VIWFRHAPRDEPFLWEETDQPPARWHGEGEGPVQYLSDTPDGAWAEFIRHEEITEESDLAGIDRALWAIEVTYEAERVARPRLFRQTLSGGAGTYVQCRAEARRLRVRGATAIEAPSAALVPGAARGQLVRGDDLPEAPGRDGQTLALFGIRRDLRGWLCGDEGRPHARVLALVNHF
jgi:hypothetical protein